MRIDIMTLFPDTVNNVLHESIIGRACSKGILEINCIQIRDYTLNKQKQVDDYPYGGGKGCVMMAQPLKSCLDEIISKSEREKRRVIYMSPQGKTFNQETARRLASKYDHLVLVCGHYEGIDERFIEECVDEEISIGDFVLTGGEIAAMAVTDSVCRMIPGVLSSEECYEEESHWNGLLEYPQYTRPEIWENRRVPEILINGDHKKVAEWRKKMSIRRTMEKRPDMYEKYNPDEAEKKIIEQINKDNRKIKIVDEIKCKETVNVKLTDDINERTDKKAAQIVSHEQNIIENEEVNSKKCIIVFHGEEAAGYFIVSEEKPNVYNELTDGRWHYSDKYLRLLYISVKEKYLGSEISSIMMKKVEEYADKNGFSSIRTDIYKKNESAKKMLTENGYRFRGNLLIDQDKRQAFEKGILL